MSDNLKQMVDLDDEQLIEVPLGRNRILRALGVALFGLAVRMTMPATAQAVHDPAPYPCITLRACHADTGYTPAYVNCPGGGGSNCWYTCADNDFYYQCCDYVFNATSSCVRSTALGWCP